MKDSVFYYRVGPLLYCPANHTEIADSLIKERFGTHFSLALCLEDTISDHHVEEAEQQLSRTLNTLFHASKNTPFFLPMIFIRVRSPRQILKLMDLFGDAKELVTGFNLPKFSLENAKDYLDAVLRVNQTSKKPVYLMPILEDASMIDLRTRADLLYELKDLLAPAEELVLNIRVGGNDLCHRFGFRRGPRESIHSIRAISDIFSDIVTVFGMDYVISGPVWEYYNGKNWEKGLKKELKEDRLCGFTGKTAIHPAQIELINDAYKVSEKDLEDARAILGWDPASKNLVFGCTKGERMNEYKVHSNWAKRILMLSEAFGVR
ncbi:MAG: HpcH/HpaI aldolase/citrate lyase family protein [Lachnospiraceae bacterium]|nr:HpcH/HpaI aldolase/citrate lyase family protein [Lachnospiraceae bacterium]